MQGDERDVKRAIITDEISQDLSRAISIAEEYGLDGVELRSVWDKGVHDLSQEELDEVKRMLKTHGLAVPCIAAPVFKCDLDNESDYEAHIEILRKSARAAAKLGCSLVRGFTFWARGDFEDKLPIIAGKIAASEPVLREFGVKLAIEYDPGTSANDSHNLVAVLRRVNSPLIGAIWDPGNSVYVPGAERFPRDYERLRPYILHVHIKDVKVDERSGKAEACRVGTGDVGFRAVLRRLADDGYAGWVSLETHYRLRSSISDELLARPGGSAFSEGGEEASRESLESLNEIMRAEGLL